MVEVPVRRCWWEEEEVDVSQFGEAPLAAVEFGSEHGSASRSMPAARVRVRAYVREVVGFDDFFSRQSSHESSLQ